MPKLKCVFCKNPQVRTEKAIGLYPVCISCGAAFEVGIQIGQSWQNGCYKSKRKIASDARFKPGPDDGGQGK